MRRWNGWGDDGVHTAPPSDGEAFIRERVGDGRPPQDATLQEALAQVPDSRLDGIAGADTGAEARLRHARGQSYPDWLAMRHGRLGPFPDTVARPRSHAEVDQLLAAAKSRGAIVVPYGGGTSVVGHLSVPESDRPILSVDLGRLSRLTDLDETARLATIGAGAPGPVLEAQLRARGYVLGHFPQSFEYSTVGGWVVTRSSGQQSLRYGRIEQLFAGGRMATPVGDLEIPTIPASSAGPDVRELVLGSEGRMGVLTEAIVRVRPLPEKESFHAVFFDGWDTAVEAVRAIGQAKLPLSMLRLSNPVETETQLMLAGHPTLLKWLDRYLRLRGQRGGHAMLMMGVTGTRGEHRFAKNEALRIARRHGGVHAGKTFGKAWARNRFHGPYLRNALWEMGYGVDTVETAVDWPRVTSTMHAMERAAGDAMGEFDERVHAFTHLSHVYSQGSSIYSTFVFRITGDYDTDYERWLALKTRISEAVVAAGGTISHQHGVGRDHKPYLPAEKGEHGIAAIRGALEYFDPGAMMNPGTLLD